VIGFESAGVGRVNFLDLGIEGLLLLGGCLKVGFHDVVLVYFLEQFEIHQQ
jgi:hypothetical protein